ncbi:MAG TPA: vWA domain-containing protein, partial [Gammaproteobacteria bacterium]|nr:vWA domain-containing protein [Gammaproteobacteria bacterium]
MKRVIFCLFAMLCFPAALMAQIDSTRADNAPRDVLLVLDNSGSMKQNDPARLTAKAVQGFIARQQPGTRVGILLFADNPRLVAPLTPVTARTRNELLSALEQLNYSGRWTETAEAVERAIYELRVNGRDHALQAIVLMTDGILDTGNAERDQQRMQWLRTSLVPEAQANNIAIFGLAFTEQADFQLLQFLAQQTGGEYFRALTPQNIAPVLDQIDSALADSAQNSQAAQDLQAQVTTTTTTPAQAGAPAAQINTTAPDRIVYSGPTAPVTVPTEPIAETRG